MAERHWADRIAKEFVDKFPKRKKYICTAGITPSGIVHIGNFRDIITSDFVVRALEEKGHNGVLSFFWDDFDRLRKIPKDVPESFSKYFGMPVSEVPDPYKCHKSYAEHFKGDFEEVTPELGINANFVSQAEEYGKNKYFQGIKTAMQKRKRIANILAKYKTQGMKKEEIEDFYPLQVYCDKCRKDTTKIVEYDEENIVSYTCKCGHKETADISKRNIGKLQWKIDWPMRWKYQDICFEPGGTDHSTEGGSYTIGKEIAKEIFDIEPPLFQGYEFVGIKDVTKMSSSAGTGISPKELLKIYEPGMLRWFFSRAKLKSPITFNFDSELIRQYDEFDEIISKHFQKKLSQEEERSLFFAKPNKNTEWAKKRVPFRQVASFGQIAQGNLKHLKEMFSTIEQKFEDESLKERLEKSQNWINNFAKELKIKVRDTPNKKYFSDLSKERKNQIYVLKEDMGKNWTLDELTLLVYSIPKKPGMDDKDKKQKQREFFKDVYQLLIDNDTGPRLPTFMLALGKDKIRKLLSF